VFFAPSGRYLSEQPEHRLVGLRGERQGGRGQLLAGLQARRFAPSSLVSANTRLSAPVCRVLIRFLVKS
jgi:hypothetical protein